MAQCLLKALAISLALLLSLSSQADVWQKHAGNHQSEWLFTTDETSLKSLLWQAPPFETDYAGSSIELPLPDGQFIQVIIFRDDILSPALSAQYPHLRSFRIHDSDGRQFIGRMSYGTQGLRAMLQLNQIVMIDKKPDSDFYQSYFIEQDNKEVFSCSDAGHEDIDSSLDSLHLRHFARKRFGNVLRSYRIAVSTTRGYHSTISGGGQDTTSTYEEIANAIDKVNFVFERDLGIRLELVSDSSLISTNSADLINGTLDHSLEKNGAWINQRWQGEYDLGHVLSTSGGGVARINSTCTSNKAQGATGASNPRGDRFYFEYLAHEIAHQFGASHTFNASNATACNSGNRQGPGSTTVPSNLHASYEPGSGSTIMAYAGICAPQNLQNGSDFYFHGASIEQVRNFVEHKSSCGSDITSTDYNPPISDAGNDYIIPSNTPFMLQGSASDQDDGDTISYNWEQMDLGSASTSLNDMHVDKGTGPLIRSRPATSSTTRSIPAMDAIIEGVLDKHIGERLPTRSRTLNFKLTVRSGLHGIDQDDMQIRVIGDAGPFRVHPITADQQAGYSVLNINWDVANTDKSPINCQRVDIKLTTDQGTSFTPLLEDVGNDGEAHIILPNITVNDAYISVHCRDNIFFHLAASPFAITAVTQKSLFAVHAQEPTILKNTAGSNTLTFLVQRHGAISQAASVNFALSNSADPENLLHAAPTSGEIQFAANDNLQLININLDSARIEQSTTTFTLTLSQATANHQIEISEAETRLQTASQDGNPIDDAPSSSKKGRKGLLNEFFLLLLVTAFLTRRGFAM